MNLRTIFSASAAATLLVIGPGWALAGPSGHIGGDATGSATGVVMAAEDGVNGEGSLDGSANLEAEFDLGDAPEAPEAPEVPEAPDAPAAPDAPEAPEVSAPDAPELPSGGSDAPDAPDAPQTPDTPTVTTPGTDSPKPKGDKPALDKGGDGSVRAEGRVGLSGSVRGDNPPEADYDADGEGSAEAAGQSVSL